MEFVPIIMKQTHFRPSKFIHTIKSYSVEVFRDGIKIDAGVAHIDFGLLWYSYTPQYVLLNTDIVRFDSKIDIAANTQVWEL